jgi:hypothetical protein
MQKVRALMLQNSISLFSYTLLSPSSQKLTQASESIRPTPTGLTKVLTNCLAVHVI